VARALAAEGGCHASPGSVLCCRACLLLRLLLVLLLLLPQLLLLLLQHQWHRARVGPARERLHR
jgi:hypothetical protein